MPRLPDASALKHRMVQDRGGIVTKRTGQIGAVLQGVAQTIGGIEERKKKKDDKLTYAHAKSEYLQADIKARAEFDGDDDYSTFNERYKEKMLKARENSLGMMSSSYDKELFELELDGDFARGNEAVRQKAWRGEVDAGRAGLAGVLDNNRAYALEKGNDLASKQAFIAASTDAVDGAKESGYISAVEAINMKKKWTDDFAESSIGLMDADQRIKILSKPKGTLAENIDADRRNLLLKAAQNEDKEVKTREKAQVQADKIISKGKPLDEQLKTARDIDDPNVRDSVVTRLKARADEATKIKLAVERDALDQGYEVADKGGRYDDIDPAVLTAMDPKDRLNLKAYMNKGAVVKTNKETWYGLTKMKTDDPREFVGLDMLKYRNSLSDADWKAMVKSQSDIQDEGDISFALRSDNQMVDDTLRAIGMSDLTPESKAKAAKIHSFRYQYQQAVDSFQKQEKRKATVDEKQKILDRMTVEVTSEDAGWFLFDKDIRAFEVGEETVLVVPEDDRAQITAALKRANREVTEQSIQAWYRDKISATR